MRSGMEALKLKVDTMTRPFVKSDMGHGTYSHVTLGKYISFFCDMRENNRPVLKKSLHSFQS